MPSLNLGIVSSGYYVPLPLVTGGTLTSDATYYYRTFTASEALSVSLAPLTADIFLLSGGGGGSTGHYDYGGGEGKGGGGGGGGIINVVSNFILNGSYNVMVGGGGIAGQSGSPGVAGWGSSLNDPVTGNSILVNNPLRPSSQGGQRGGYLSGGNIGGNSWLNSSIYTGGIGGLNQPGGGGASPSFSTSTKNGAAPYSSSFGVFGGGGGGGASHTSSAGTGGTYGGNGGAYPVGIPSAGAANKGGGGGGGTYQLDAGNQSNGANGGSGIVIVGYTKAQVGG